MKQKLNSILMVDDDPATNFLHELILKRLGCANQVASVLNGIQALEYLQKMEHSEYPRPDLILLDINMPGMNGWEFLDHYKNLEAKHRGRKVIVMLTTQLDPENKARAKNISDIDGFIHKPLTTNTVMELIQNHFEEYL